jgi:hypothetical protein
VPGARVLDLVPFLGPHPRDGASVTILPTMTRRGVRPTSSQNPPRRFGTVPAAMQLPSLSAMCSVRAGQAGAASHACKQVGQAQLAMVRAIQDLALP